VLSGVRAIKMNENQRKFFTTKYSEIPRSRIGFYSILAASCFGIVGLITGEIKINVIGGCSAIIFIQLLGKWCDFVKLRGVRSQQSTDKCQLLRPDS
jgi:hypothetical protein